VMMMVKNLTFCNKCNTRYRHKGVFRDKIYSFLHTVQALSSALRRAR